MIQARELRVGNLTKDGKVTALYMNQFAEGFDVVLDDFFTCSLDYLQPITLTPEILEKCGFVHNEPNSYWKNKNGFRIEGYKYKGYYLKGFYREDSLKYLHQLQNLYFALTGNELPLNPI